MNVAAFFDLDGTLLAHPSLELRFVRHALTRGIARPHSCAAWLLRHSLLCATNVRLGAEQRIVARNSNKLWLAGIPEEIATSWAKRVAGQLQFFPEALARIRWHVAQSHRVFIVSGGLAPMIRAIAEEHPALRNVEVSATQREIDADGAFNCRLRGPAIAGIEKARTVEKFAARHDLDLDQSFAYANSSADRWFLASVRHCFAVNPDRGLARAARAFGWPVLHWRAEVAAEMCQSPKSAHPIT
jgi:HAD superfamily hydrolase (TIGR01490 family)